MNSGNMMIKFNSAKNTKIHLCVTLKESTSSDFQRLLEISTVLKRENLLDFELIEK